ncbi:MAG: hypothetical protein LBH29_07330, partial [Elusimicrobiota bacterium]|nr:hypothetical protein [Elusimicrobiota bacterium]
MKELRIMNAGWQQKGRGGFWIFQNPPLPLLFAVDCCFAFKALIKRKPRVSFRRKRSYLLALTA